MYLNLHCFENVSLFHDVDGDMYRNPTMWNGGNTQLQGQLYFQLSTCQYYEISFNPKKGRQAFYWYSDNGTNLFGSKNLTISKSKVFHMLILELYLISPS